MSQRTLKKLQYDGSDVVVEVANRDGNGNVITSTYATKSEVTTGLSGKQPNLTAGTGIDITNNVISVVKATASILGGMKIGNGLEASGTDGTVKLSTASAEQLGGVKIGSGISINNGVISVTSLTWDNVSSKPFNTVDSGSGKHFTITSNKLYVNTDVFPTKTFVGDNYVTLTAYNTLVNTTLPATYQGKNNTLTSLSGLATNKTGLIKLTNGTASIDTNTYLTSHQSLANYYTKSEITGLFNGVKQFSYEVVSSLPTASADTMYKIYFVPASNTATNNVKNEYITIRSGSEGSYTYSWEQIGSTVMDLSSYLTTSTGLRIVEYAHTAKISDVVKYPHIAKFAGTSGSLIYRYYLASCAAADSSNCDFEFEQIGFWGSTYGHDNNDGEQDAKRRFVGYEVANSTSLSTILGDNSSYLQEYATTAAVANTYQTKLTSSNAGTGISISNQVISWDSPFTVTDVTLDY